jgi:hypothetical protein
MFVINHAAYPDAYIYEVEIYNHKLQCIEGRAAMNEQFWRFAASSCVFRACNIDSVCEISSSHDGEYEVQICLLGCNAV